MSLGIFLFQICAWLVGIPLVILVILALVRGPYRQFPFVFLYCLALLITTLVEMPGYVRYFFTHDAATWRQAASLYWIDEAALQLLVFATVISLIEQATAPGRSRRLLRTGWIAGALLFAGISFWIHYIPPPVQAGFWMTRWTRDLSFCATGLDLALWFMLVASRGRDRRLLMISGALGIQFTGEAIGAGIRDLSVPQLMLAVAMTGSIVTTLSDMTCLYLWWQTFRAKPTGNRT